MAGRTTLADRRASSGALSGFDWNGEEWAAAFAAAVDEIKLRSEADLLTLALRVQNQARRLCPVDTGRLRSSIQAGPLEHDSAGPYVEVGTNVAYAGHVEFGTTRSGAQPFLRPALLDAASAMRRSS